MARLLDRKKALELRGEGMTYGQISSVLGVPKSTISVWLREFEINKSILHKLYENRAKVRITAAVKANLSKSKIRYDKFVQSKITEKFTLLPLTRKESYIAGLMLYAGEGTKGDNSTVSLCNTNPEIVRFFVNWLVEYCGVSKQDLRVLVHIYRDMNVQDTLSYWSQTIDIPLSQFIRPYMKTSKRSDLTHKGFDKGTCSVYIYNVELKRKIRAGMDILMEQISTV